MFRDEEIILDFPILNRMVNNHSLVYLDNGATTQKPNQVLNAIREYNECHHSNIHRGVHQLSIEATLIYESARERVAKFIGGASDEVVFTAGTTDGINGLAYSIGKKTLKKGDQVLVTFLEHHSNFLPWKVVCEEKQASLLIAPISKDGKLDLEWIKNTIEKGSVKIFAFTHVSNALGVTTPIKEIASLSRKHGVITVVDGAQFVSHHQTNVTDFGIDFYCFGGHKMYGPTGVGVLWGRKEILESLDPWRWGGGMIQRVSLSEIELAACPQRFEAGTPPIEGVVGLVAAMDYLDNIGWQNLNTHEHFLLKKAEETLQSIENVIVYAEGAPKTGVISFNVAGAHPSDIGTILNQIGIAVRTGHHCCQPLMKCLGIEGTIRAGFGVYNTEKEINLLAEGVKKAIKMLGL